MTPAILALLEHAEKRLREAEEKHGRETNRPEERIHWRNERLAWGHIVREIRAKCGEGDRVPPRR